MANKFIKPTLTRLKKSQEGAKKAYNYKRPAAEDK
jgi:hypothetical protein